MPYLSYSWFVHEMWTTLNDCRSIKIIHLLDLFKEQVMYSVSFLFTWPLQHRIHFQSHDLFSFSSGWIFLGWVIYNQLHSVLQQLLEDYLNDVRNKSNRRVWINRFINSNIRTQIVKKLLFPVSTILDKTLETMTNAELRWWQYQNLPGIGMHLKNAFLRSYRLFPFVCTYEKKIVAANTNVTHPSFRHTNNQHSYHCPLILPLMTFKEWPFLGIKH